VGGSVGAGTIRVNHGRNLCRVANFKKFSKGMATSGSPVLSGVKLRE
jgi:hypothetical protein